MQAMPHEQSTQWEKPECTKFKECHSNPSSPMPHMQPMTRSPHDQKRVVRRTPSPRCQESWIINSEYARIRNVRDIQKKEIVYGLIQETIEYVKQFKSITIDPFWHRKSQKVVLSVLMIQHENHTSQEPKYEFIRSINVEVSLPSGSACAERNAIGSAVGKYPNIKRTQFIAIAVVDPNDTLNPISPCGVCDEWLKKIQEESKHFMVLTFNASTCTQVIERRPIFYQTTETSFYPPRTIRNSIRSYDETKRRSIIDEKKKKYYILEFLYDVAKKIQSDNRMAAYSLSDNVLRVLAREKYTQESDDRAIAEERDEGDMERISGESEVASEAPRDKSFAKNMSKYIGDTIACSNLSLGLGSVHISVMNVLEVATEQLSIERGEFLKALFDLCSLKLIVTLAGGRLDGDTVSTSRFRANARGRKKEKEVPNGDVLLREEVSAYFKTIPRFVSLTPEGLEFVEKRRKQSK